MFKQFIKGWREDIDAIMRHDPAATSRLEVALLYPGLHAVLWHRLAAGLWRRKLHFLARFIAQFARLLTGIEIHPAAIVGRRLFIDHGMGVVIGETAIIGDDVTLYHGVTLGGTSLTKGVKRHPTLGNGVIVGAGAQILGPVIIGEGARIGANAVVLTDLPAHCSAVGVPARVVTPKAAQEEEEFVAYGTVDCPDERLQRLHMLEERVLMLEEQLMLGKKNQKAI
ncbi:MAG: serine O-acetyltransferase EpsC [Alphaproteobacteria bacterium]